MALAENLSSIQHRIEAACVRSKRDPQEVMLLAVSKGHPPEAIKEATDAGLTYFGESKVQEAKAKIPLAPGKCRWHMIGHLQTNKIRDAVHLFEMIESVDSLHLAQEINQSCDKQAKTMRILLEVNVAGESSKFGYKPEQLLADLEQINALPKIEVHGLMTIAPYATDAEKVRPIFRRLRDLKTECENKIGAPIPHLSMGMSGDFEVAIEEGATIVRLGTILFGARSYAKKKIGAEAEDV